MRAEAPPFTDRYIKFTQLCTRTQVEEETEQPIPEKSNPLRVERSVDRRPKN